MTNKYKPQVPSIIDDFQKSGDTYELLSSQDGISNTEWIENNFAIASWGRIDWSKMLGSVCTRYRDDSELITAFEKIVKEKELGGGTLIISWSNAAKLPIKISMEVLIKHAENIFYEEFDTWICNEQDGWCIEHYHENEICFGKCVQS